MRSRKSIRGAAAAAVAIAAAAAIAAGCGGTVIDDQKTEGAIKQNLEKAFNRKIASVDCPSGQSVDPGATFDCTVRAANGAEAIATLKILNEDGDIRIVGLRAKRAAKASK